MISHINNSKRQEMSLQQTKKIFSFGSDYNGLGEVIFNWSQDYSFIAVCGESKNVYILDKRGKRIKEQLIQGKNKVVSLEWDKDNEILAVMQEGQNFVWLWNVFGNSINKLELDSEKPKVTFVKWSKTHPVLVVGSDKGGLLFYNKKNQKKIPTMGKHGKKVITGDWNKDGLLVTGSEDKQLTTSTYNSETVHESVAVKLEPKKVRWARPKTDQRDQPQKTITAVLSQKSILMYDIGSNKTPLELVFEQRYGKIVDYSLFGDGYIVVGFAEGYVAHISTHMQELSDEVSSERVFQSTLDALTTNDTVFKMAVAGENQIKIYNLATWSEIQNERIELPKNAGKVTKLTWSSNGQFLVASTQNGYIFGILTSIPSQTTSFGSFTAVLSGFTEVQIFDTSRQGNNLITMVMLSSEPNFVTLGPYHVVAGINNMVWYYMWLDQKRNGVIKGGDLVQKRDYYGSVKQVCVNGYWAAVLADNKCILHPIDPNQAPKDFKEKMYPNLSGTKILLQDNKGNTYYFEASSEYCAPIQGFPNKADQVLWDQANHNLFSVLENNQLYTFLINKNNIFGTIVAPIKELLSIDQLNQPNAQPVFTILDKGVKPLSMINGFLKCFTPSGSIQGQYLTSHSYLADYKWEEDTKEGHYRYYLQNLCLNQYSNSLFAATQMDNLKLYDALGRKALENVELDVAIKAFKLSKNLSMVMTIQSFYHENEKNIIFANIAMILGQYDLAQELFIKSSMPINAVEMRSDIQDYVTALNLAKKLAPQLEPYICRRLAMLRESQGNDQDARQLFEKSVINEESKILSERQKINQHNQQCMAGIARTSIKSGDINKGIQIAKNINDKPVLIEIAVVCENMKQYDEAAELYERAGMLEKAAVLYINQKEFKKASLLMNQIKSNKLLSTYAKSKEAEGDIQEAEKFYEKAEDWENVIRLNLMAQIYNFEKAKLIVRRKCQSSTGASMVAQVCDKEGFKDEACEFLILAGKKQEAFLIAQSSGCMDVYVSTLVEQVKNFSQEDALKVAQYYEGQNSWVKSAENYEKANNPGKALKLYFKCGDSYIPQMIDLVSKHKDQALLVQNLNDYLGGELGDGPKDPKWLLELQQAIGNTKAVVSIAITISQDEMDRASFKEAHRILFNTYQKLKEEQLGIPYDLEQRLLLVHSYQIVKRVVKSDDHENAAWLLHRVSSNISMFQAAKINIFTSAVIESSRAQIKVLAYKWAVELIRPENRKDINEKYKSKIENIARKPVRDEIVENRSECPYCKNLVEEYSLDCKQCQNMLPFCIASGKHIVLEWLTFCPECQFPANINYFKKVLQVDPTCPMCEKLVDSNQLTEVGQEGLAKLKQIRQGKPKEVEANK
ncbi:hypothetical protein PPERSA_05695 [Pseudocohnilembus persalinus]|uniref:WD40-repeat-containing domain n=1 Tax=Pseudocohnilembus persalinus TaxID=266149 RepID=A0A0V0QLV2_PSEPJ|nr:hypothetical protein PPERSA_05695 [Pseudocohnilembus persalinus]|eukprot:KRX03337.1 hypothetical protein PPERSA_05695 [Pseudocohnilembus persalinus]